MATKVRKYLGVTHRDYRKILSILRSRINVLEKLMSEGLLESDGDYIRLTELGIDVSNYVLSEFLIE